MKKNARDEWKKYAVGKPSTKKNWTNTDCCPLTTVHHICHISDAFRVLEDGRIRSSLIWDESRLNNTRTCVSWLSPNHWPSGSLYGNIEFHFDWEESVKDKNFFWVEAINYKSPAYRILITDKDAVGDLEKYPVEGGDGPLFFDRPSDQWYCNERFTGEFMIDQDLPLRLSTGIRYCDHNRKICSKDQSACRELGLPWNKAGARFIAKAIGQGLLRSSPRNRQLFMDGDRLQTHTESCVQEIMYGLINLQTGGSVISSDDAALPLASAILDRFGRGKKVDSLTRLFTSPAELELAIRNLMSKQYDMKLSDVPATDDYQ